MQVDVEALKRVAKDVSDPINRPGWPADMCAATIGKVGGVWFRLVAFSESEAAAQDYDEVAPGDLCLKD